MTKRYQRWKAPTAGPSGAPAARAPRVAPPDPCSQSSARSLSGLPGRRGSALRLRCRRLGLKAIGKVTVIREIDGRQTARTRYYFLSLPLEPERSLGGETVIRCPLIWGLSGKCRSTCRLTAMLTGPNGKLRVDRWMLTALRRIVGVEIAYTRKPSKTSGRGDLGSCWNGPSKSWRIHLFGAALWRTSIKRTTSLSGSHSVWNHAITSMYLWRTG